MHIGIRKSTLYQVLFTLCVALPYINVYELTFLIWGASIVLTIRDRYSLGFIKYIGYFLAILVIALIVGLTHTFRMYFFLKDITYLIKPVFGLLIGYQLCRDHVRNPIHMAIYTGTFIAIAHICVVLWAIGIMGVRKMDDLRLYAGYFSDYEVYIVIFLMFPQQFGVEFSEKKRKMLLWIVGFSAAAYVARTNFLQFLILYLAMKGYLKLTKKSVTIIASLVVLGIIGYAAVYSTNPRRGAKGLEGLMYKIKVAPMEPFKTKVDVDDWVDFNDNYRSYENILTIRQVSMKGPAAVAFGEGLGSSIDLKREVWLQTSMMRYIPFLHNGFMTVFLKSGLLGICFYLASIIFFFRQRKSDIPLVKNLNLLFLGTGIFLFISSWVFLGFYNLFDSKSIIMGLLLAYAERLKKQQQ